MDKMLNERSDREMYTKYDLTENKLNTTHTDIIITADIDNINSVRTKEETVRIPAEECNTSDKSSVIASHSSLIETEECTLVNRVEFEGLSENDNKSSSKYSKDIDKADLSPSTKGIWGLVVVISAFIIITCVELVILASGLLYSEFNAYFNSSKISLIVEIFTTIPSLCGPIISVLIDSYGCRKMTIVAGIMSTVGFLLTAISSSVEILCLTYGVISGFAIGILYMTAIVSVALWFDKRRNFAVSFASCGIVVAAEVCLPLMSYLLSIYNWRNVIIILAGMLLNMCVCGAVLRDPVWLIIKQRRKRKQLQFRMTSSVSSKSLARQSSFKKELKDLIKSGESPEYILQTITKTIKETEQLAVTRQINAELNKRIHSHVELPTFTQKNEKGSVEVMEKLLDIKKIKDMKKYAALKLQRKSKVDYREGSLSKENLNEPTANEVQFLSLPIKENFEGETIPLMKFAEKKNIQAVKQTMIRPDQEADDLNTSQTHNTEDFNWLVERYIKEQKILNETFKSNMEFRIPKLNLNYKSRATSMPNMYRNSKCLWNSEPNDDKKWYHRLWRFACKSFDVRMFNELHFLMLNLFTVIFHVWFSVPYYYLISYMTSLNIEGGEANIATIELAVLTGFIAHGWIGDIPCVNVPKTYTYCIIVCGISVACYPLFITNRWPPAIISAIFGITLASTHSYTPSMLLACVPIDHCTKAYGFIIFSEGVGNLVASHIADNIYKVSENWEIPFYAGGIWIVLSGLCVGVIAYTKNLRLFGHGPLLKDLDSAL